MDETAWVQSIYLQGLCILSVGTLMDVCVTAPPGQRLPQLCESSHEDVVLSLLLRPSSPKTLPELLLERDARVSGQPGRPGHRVEQLSW